MFLPAIYSPHLVSGLQRPKDPLKICKTPSSHLLGDVSHNCHRSTAEVPSSESDFRTRVTSLATHDSRPPLCFSGDNGSYKGTTSRMWSLSLQPASHLVLDAFHLSGRRLRDRRSTACLNSGGTSCWLSMFREVT